MLNLITEISKYLIVLLFAFYTYECFAVFRKKYLLIQRVKMYKRQMICVYLIHFDAFLVMFFATKDIRMIGFYLVQVIFMLSLHFGYKMVYKDINDLLLNNMCMLLMIGFVILTRLNFDKALRQFVIAVVAAAITFAIPFIIKKARFFRKLTWAYAAIGVALLGVVAIAGSLSYGAKLSFTFAGITIQPSEFIKILYVFFIAGMFYEATEFSQVVKTTIVAAFHVLILVLSKDLGGALIFFVVYLVMLYVATGKLYYFAGGFAAGGVAAFIAYKLFRHVRVRVVAWKNPLGVIENEGYQICQSLFAIGTGSWFGMGLYQGVPNTIPVVEQDFVFSAIAEEFGGIFALCLILVYVSCILMFFNVSMQMNDRYYKYVALGLGTVFGFQVFLTLGGVTKFIPSTGVTLPFISYGGSSLLSTFIIFAIIQGLVLMKENGERIYEKGYQESENGRKKKTERRKAKRTTENFEDF
ncbi:MAG: FtsW/RodA/SpoVE family cell cycle protein [Roseburia sp.]|nr:FtsW/RodA/SpoVE family cell cycle protein [Lachnospiraceae bacterium]